MVDGMGERSQASKVVIAADAFGREVRRNGITGKAAKLRNAMKAEIVALDQQRAGAVEALRTYGTHLPNCALRVEDDEDVSVECDCGYSAARGGQ
jgi:hypothetical protein